MRFGSRVVRFSRIRIATYGVIRVGKIVGDRLRVELRRWCSLFVLRGLLGGEGGHSCSLAFSLACTADVGRRGLFLLVIVVRWCLLL